MLSFPPTVSTMMILKGGSAHHQKEVIRAACLVLQKGGVIAFPTETTYGLGCDPRNARAVKEIFQIKGRVETKPLQLIAGSLAQVQRLAVMTAAEKRLASRYWPGPLTLLLRLRQEMNIAKQVSPKHIIGIRVSSSECVRDLVRAFGHPIAATSANRSGSTPAFSGRGVVRAFAEFPHAPDLVLDRGALPRRKSSTVARVREDGEIEILRQGAVRSLSL